MPPRYRPVRKTTVASARVEPMNGKRGDNPLSDLTVHGAHPFPPDIEELLLRIEELGRRDGRWALGENWPYSPREFDWAAGRDLDEAHILLGELQTALEEGRGDDVLVDPMTRRPLSEI
jgi:hypothetical protein